MFNLGIIGRPNVGKSTLFNRIAGRRIAITDDMPGVTRDRIEVETSWLGKDFKLVDTAGFDLQADILKKEMQEQFFKALEEADFLILVVDASDGLHALDEIVCDMLRKCGKPFIVAVNKADSNAREQAVNEFYKLGDVELFPISALHGRNVDDIMAAVQNTIDIENQIKKVESMKEEEKYSGKEDQKALDDILEGLNKQYDLAKNQMTKTFEKGIGQMQSYQEQISNAKADVGNRIQRLELTKSRLTEQKTNFTSLKSQNEDIDLEEVVINYTSAQLVYNAALSAASKVVQQTLLDFIG